MATNWQPPFGLPYTMPAPPQQAQSQSQSQYQAPNGQYQPHNGSWTPQADEHVSSWHIPGLNAQSYHQNAQSAYPPAGWPPSVSNPQMWHQAMQTQFPMLSNGAYALPPMPYNPASFTQPPPQNASHPPPPGLSPAAPSFQPTQQPPPAVSNNQHTDLMDTDKEDGEVSETDLVSKAPSGNSTPYQKPPPRSTPQTAPKSDGPLWASHRERYPPPAAAQKPVDPDVSNPITRQREDAKKFVKLLHSHNIGYRTLAAEDLDPAHLKDLYRSLNLPSEPEHVPLPQEGAPEAPAASGASSALMNDTSSKVGKPLASVTTNIATAPPVKSVPSPADRKDYIARLQAAKKGKQVATAKTASPCENLSPTSKPEQIHDFFQDIKVKDQQTLAEQEKARQTQLIQERIQALKKNPSSPAPSQITNAKTSLNTEMPSTNLQSSSVAQPSPLPTKPQEPPQTTPISSFSGIPGLFMHSSTAGHEIQATPNARKRPLASVSIHSSAAAKGAGPLSMAVDEIGDSTNRSGSGTIAKSSNVPPPVVGRNEQQVPLVVSASTPSRPASVKPAQSTTNTPGVQTPSSQARIEELDEKQKALAAAKRQAIQKLRKQREEKQQKERLAETSSKDTYVSRVPNPQQAFPLATNVTQQLGNSAQIAVPDSFTDDESPRNVKRLRRAKIELDLPNLDAEMAANSAKIDLLSKQLEQLIAEDKRMQQDKARLIQELEQLGIDTEGMEHKELKATKDAIEREQATSTHTAGSEPPATAIPQAPVPVHSDDPSLPHSSPAVVNHPPVVPKDLPSLSVQSVPRAVSAITSAQSSGIPGLGTSMTPLSPSSATQTWLPGMKSSGDAAAASKIAKPSDLMEAATPMDDDEDFYSPKASGEPATNDVTMRSPSEDGEVPMSESEEEYAPDEPQEVVKQILPQATQAVSAKSDAVVAVQTSSTSSSDEEELYEPPEADPSVPDTQTQEVTSNLDASVSQGEADDGAMDISSSENSDSSDSDAASPAKSPPRGVIIVNESQAKNNAVLDAKEIDLSQPQPDPWAFNPYESPLRKFKSYRYHPGYAADVPGGYLSMTYSHQIDPNVPLCPAEALGNTCTDASCENQHFRQMNISGEKLLVQLGTANPGKTPLERQQWNDGLRHVLKELRMKNSKDPNLIAVEIAKYRRQFLNDNTRVINL